MIAVPAGRIFRLAASFRGQPWGVTAGENGVDNTVFAQLTAFLQSNVEKAWTDAPVPENTVVARRQRLQSTFYIGGSGGITIPKGSQLYDPATNANWTNVRDITGVEPLNVPGNSPSIWVELKRDYSDGARDYNLATSTQTASIGEIWRFTGDGTVGGDYYYCFASVAASMLTDSVNRGTYFFLLPSFNPDFALDAAWHTSMGAVLGVWDTNPEDDSPDTVELNYDLTDDGVRVEGDPGAAWFEFTTVAPIIFGSPISSSLAYGVGDQVYFDTGTTGDFYNIISATAVGDTPITAPSKFSKVEIPHRYSLWLSAQLSSDWYSFDGVVDKAALRQAMADREWRRLKYILGRRERQGTRLNVQTR